MENKLLDRIKKLQSLAGNNPSESEAIAAAAKVQELLLEHNLSMADVDGHEVGETAEKVGKARYTIPNADELTITWKSYLYHGIAKNNFCNSLSHRGTLNISIVGKPSNVIAVCYLADVLINQIERLAAKEAKSVLRNKALFQREYCFGAAQRIVARLREARERSTASVTSQALVLASGAELARVFGGFFPDVRRVSTQVSGRTSGFGAGRNAGNGISLPGGGITAGTRGLLGR